MRRRDVLTIMTGGVAASWAAAIPAIGQPGKMPTIGFVRSTSAADSAHMVAALRRGLKEEGFAEGENVVVEYRWANGHDDRLPALVAELLSLDVAVLITANLAAMAAAKKATATTPIVFTTGDDPVTLGFVDSFNRPTGNITGASFYSGTLGPKQLELLHEIVPKADRIGMLTHNSNPAAASQVEIAQRAAAALGQEILVGRVSSATDLQEAFSSFAQRGAGAVLVSGDALFMGQRQLLATLAARHALPTIHFAREFVAAGGLMSYGTSIPDAYRQMGIYAGRILKGAKPADLPITMPTKFVLAINLKTAKALRVSIPPSVLAIADEVIE
jgi:putative ABC transport system substrate-binding protein